MTDKVTQFLGDTPGRTAVKLVIISLVVGIVMSAIGWTPVDVWYAIRDFFDRVWQLGFRAFGRFGEYLLYGAMIVVPVFLLSRLFSMRR